VPKPRAFTAEYAKIAERTKSVNRGMNYDGKLAKNSKEVISVISAYSAVNVFRSS
jgi:hypothetical protein